MRVIRLHLNIYNHDQVEKIDRMAKKEIKTADQDPENMVLVPKWNAVDTWNEDLRDYDNPLIGVNVFSFDDFLGKLFTSFELLGLPDRQAKALTSSVRRMAWEWYDKHLPNPSGLMSPSLQARRALNSHKKTED